MAAKRFNTLFEKFMKNTLKFYGILFLIVTFTQCRQAVQQPNEKLSFDESWLFAIAPDSTASLSRFDDSKWRELDLPHDWAIEDSVSQGNKSGVDGGFFVAGTAWYRKHFNAQEEWKNKKIAIRFDGVFMNSDVWLNGNHLGKHTYGYSGFSLDLTTHLRFDTVNVISVKVDNSNPPASRWYTGSGIYRHTWIETTEKVFIPFGGTYITTATSNNKSQVNVQTTVINETGSEQALTLKLQIKDRDKKVVAELTQDKSVATETVLESQIPVESTQLWTPETPNLYSLETTVLAGNKVLYFSSERFGIRNIAFDKDLGFLLNGEKVILKGVCIHHDAGSLGAAVPDVANLRQLLLLKELGCNSIRLSHNPHSPVLLDMCDSLGFLVINEMFDKWSTHLTGYNTTEVFENEREDDLKYFVKRDRNRPSVILWTVGNETDEQKGDAKSGIEIYGKLKAVVKSLDQSRLVSVAMHPGPGGYGPYSLMTKDLDVIAYNYRADDFPEWKKDFPNQPFLVTETKPYHERSVKNSTIIDYSFNTWLLMEKYPFIAGQYIWTGIDYLGESMLWPRKGLSCGLIYTNGFFKPYGYYTQSIYSDKPMVHIAVVDDSIAFTTDTITHWYKDWFGPPVVSHWNHAKQPNDSVKVLTYSNCDEVELYLNGESIGIKKLDQFPDKVIKWNVAYEPGNVKAVGRKAGKIVEHELETAGTATQLSIYKESSGITTAPNGTFAIIVSVTDEKQRICPKSRDKITLNMSGNAKILGVDNGDLYYHGLYQTNEVEVRDGKVLVWVKIGKKADKVTITATAKGLKSSELSIL